MLLSSIFIPTMAYVQSVEQLVSPDAQVVHEQIQSLILEARAQALGDELTLERFREALFPVVAWCDERLGNLPAWKANHDWRPLMLQKKLTPFAENCRLPLMNRWLLNVTSMQHR